MLRMLLFLLLRILFLPRIKCNSNDAYVSLNASVDSSLTLYVNLTLQNFIENEPQGSITGYSIYFTDDGSLPTEDYKRGWKHIEVLHPYSKLDFRIRKQEYGIRPNTLYRLMATVFINEVEGKPSEIVQLNTKAAAYKAPVIKSSNVLINSSVIIQFVPAEDVPLVTNYTLQYRELNEADWQEIFFISDNNSRFLLEGLSSNRTYAARLFATGEAVQGTPSREIHFSTEDSAELPSIELSPMPVLELDPDISTSAKASCTSKSAPTPPSIQWTVNGESLHLDHSFYTVTSVVHGLKTTSVILAKSRTRSDTLTCIASNSAGSVEKSVDIKIRGPGSPPSSIILSVDKGSYTVSWQPPSHPNGEIKKYVVYHSLNKDEPLSDWHKIDLDGTERKVKIFSDGSDAFYVRVQAASDLGPGIISDVVAIESDTVPIAVSLSIKNPHQLEPGQNITVSCFAKGFPRPTLQFALSDQENPLKIEDDVWYPLKYGVVADQVMASIDVSLISSKYLHCRAKNSAGVNSSSVHFIVDKPGDCPRNLQILSIDSKDIVVVWEEPLYPNKGIDEYEVFLIDSTVENDEEPVMYQATNRAGLPIKRLSIASKDLKPSTMYQIRVRALNEAGRGPLSPPVSFVTPNGGPEAMPSDVKVEIDEANTAVLTWSPPNCTTPVLAFSIYFTRDLGQSNDDYREWQTVDVPGDVHRLKMDYHLGLKPKTFYRVRVAAKNDVAEGPVSVTVEFETALSSLPIPTDVVATVEEDNTLHITFPAVRDPDDHTTAIQNYKVEMLESEQIVPGKWQITHVDTKTVDDVHMTVSLSLDGHHLLPNTMYWIRITVQLDNPSRLVQASKPIYVRTGRGKLKTKADILEGTTIIAEPNLAEKLTVFCKAEGTPAPNITWRWNDSYDIKNGVNGWTIDCNYTEKTTVSHLTRSTLSERGHLECYASNAEGNASKTIDIHIQGPGSPPCNITVSSQKNYINITWLPPKLPNGDVTKYLIYDSLHATEDLNEWRKNEVEGNQTNFDLPVVSPSVNHYIRLQAVSVNGAGIISESLQCISDEKYVPIVLTSAPTSLEDPFVVEPKETIEMKCSGTGSPTPKLSYYWDDLEETAISDEYLEVDGEEFSGTFEMTTVSNRTVHCRAFNKFETVDANATVVVRKPGDAPSNIKWEFTEEGRLFIEWDKCLYPNGNVSYHLYLSQSDVVVPGPPVLWAKDEIPLNVQLVLKISAINEWGEGEKSEAIIVNTPNGGPRDSPKIVSVALEERSVKLSWAAPRFPLGPIQMYKIHLSKKEHEEEAKVFEVDGHITEHLIEGLEEGLNYELAISARNDIAEGPLSEPYLLSTIVATPTNISAILSNGSLSIHFPVNHNFKDLIIYIRKVDVTMPQKVQVFNVSSFDKTISIPWPKTELDSKYFIKVAGFVEGVETEHSAEVELLIKKDDNELAKNSDLASNRKVPVKEPPL
ncbi:unnamed protein product [Auanema sp. JU1783]|nr:unnamed protein product [Auanema sp. JU1783]